MLIGISGKAGSGKDTVGMILQALSMENNCLGSTWSKKPLEYVKGYEGRPNYKGGWQIKKFAGKLKTFVADLLGVEVELLEDREFKESELGPEWTRILRTYQDGVIVTVDVTTTVREMLVEIGTGLRNTFHADIWVNALFADYTKYSFTHNDKLVKPDWIITDMRFPNEIKAVKDRDGYTIRVNSDRAMQSNRESETALDSAEFDFVIDNNGDMKELLEKVKVIYEKVKT